MILRVHYVWYTRVWRGTIYNIYSPFERTAQSPISPKQHRRRPPPAALHIELSHRIEVASGRAMPITLWPTGPRASLAKSFPGDAIFDCIHNSIRCTSLSARPEVEHRSSQPPLAGVGTQLARTCTRVHFAIHRFFVLLLFLFLPLSPLPKRWSAAVCYCNLGSGSRAATALRCVVCLAPNAQTADMGASDCRFTSVNHINIHRHRHTHIHIPATTLRSMPIFEPTEHSGDEFDGKV